VHGIEQRPGAGLTSLLAFIRHTSADLALNRVQFADATQSFRRERRGMGLLQIVKLAPDVRLIWGTR
jgi:hypothetical protein